MNKEIIVSIFLGFFLIVVFNARAETLFVENISALTAKKSADSELTSLKITADLVDVQAAIFKGGRGGFNITAWDFLYRNNKNASQYIRIQVELQEQQGSKKRYLIHTKAFHVPESDVTFSKGRPPLPTKSKLLDNNEAEKLALAGGGFPDHGLFHLHMGIVNEKYVPVWLLPYNYPDFSHRAIRADNGEFVYLIMGNMNDRSWMMNPKWATSKPRP